MISKVITGKTFYGACRYVCMDEKRAVVLTAEGVRDYNYKFMAADFEMQHAMRPSLNKAVFHGILSFYPGEKLSDQKMVEIAKEYLLEMKIIDTQFAIVKHLDKNHSHLHILANLVNNKGETIKDNWIGLRGKKAAQKLTLKHGLKEAVSKNLELTNLEALSEREASRYLIYQAILEKLSLSNSLDDLKEKLATENIETLYKFKGQTDELQGISFRLAEFKYKGSEIDRKFSLKNLEKALLEQRMQKLLKSSQTHSQLKSLSDNKHHDIGKYKAQDKSIIGELLKAEKIDESVPHNFQIKKHRQKKSRGRHL